MKRLFIALLAIITSSAFGTTLNPVQLLNPAGSSSGQAVVSTGSSSAPAWANMAVTALAAQAANTVVANVTGSSASPTAFAMPSCSTSASALNWTTSTGFTCNTAVNAATLSGNAIGTSGATVPLLNGVNTWSGAQAFTSTITPSQTAGIVGTTTNNNANAGSVGEFVSSTVLIGSAVSVGTSGTATNITSISLSAGDWDVWGNVVTFPAGSTTTQGVSAGISTTSASLGTFPSNGAVQDFPFNTSAGQLLAISAGITRLSLSSTTTVFLVIQPFFSVSTMSAYGFIGARRIR